MLFEKLLVWRDETPRSGPENMAVDEWLLESLDGEAIFRIYSWEGPWVSLGYFQSLKLARDLFGDEPDYVRRWTGGGVVDHRNDLTYTLAIPRGHELAGRRGSESYCAIHRVIAKCLGEGGLPCGLTPEDSRTETVACFEKPVAWDLLGENGEKIAGAGQRRSRYGVLHQGSVQAPAGALDGLPHMLGGNCQPFAFEALLESESRVSKYASKGWLERKL
ncbi:MAG: lipoyl protein ligase domain-containing protein [Akkermansiaceae bacterium]